MRIASRQTVRTPLGYFDLVSLLRLRSAGGKRIICRTRSAPAGAPSGPRFARSGRSTSRPRGEDLAIGRLRAARERFVCVHAKQRQCQGRIRVAKLPVQESWRAGQRCGRGRTARGSTRLRRHCRFAHQATAHAMLWDDLCSNHARNSFRLSAASRDRCLSARVCTCVVVAGRLAIQHG
jgi:hypothetical protein